MCILYSLSLVSTHSRLKAAGRQKDNYSRGFVGFNTQPPEGGWVSLAFYAVDDRVSTHSRLKAAGFEHTTSTGILYVSTHSRLKAAG